MKRYPSCIMATCCIPWDAAGQFAEAIFRRGVRTTLTHGTKHLYVFGTAGEGYAVTDRQFDQIVAAFADEMRQGNAEPMVGVISLSLGTICERIERCRDIGMRQFQISLPSWGALADHELFNFFDTVCSRFPDCQFIHYNLPRTKRLVTGKEYGRLAEAHPNLVATKNCGDSQSHLRSLIEDAPQLQHFLSEAGYVYGSLFGECGILASFIMNWPKLKALWEAGRRRDIDTMVSIQREVDIVIQTLFETVPDGRIDGSYDKLFEKMYDAEFPLRLLPPYVGSSDEEYQAFVRLLRERLPEWVPVAEGTS
ncbi:MAG: dihydrodipicolinate synthase family protein [Planctomycetota bacterium]|nr:dihydrodipicolinate synthase family protein [Planctomycetota bacterium]